MHFDQPLDPFICKDFIERLPVTRPGELAALLPANWAAANRAAKPAIKSDRPQAA